MISHYDRTGAINLSLAFITTAQFVYVADALLFESAILSTMDIIHESFGFMLAFGDLAWVPFTYTLQARYISAHNVQLSPVHLVWIVILNAIGYLIFRASNLEKDRFRSNPDHPSFSDCKTIETNVCGRRILCDRWWGLLRHPNYLGDIIMAWAWCLSCGFSSIVPYFYGFYLTALLICREVRDEKWNVDKYGQVWHEYCRKVPYRIFPKIW